MPRRGYLLVCTLLSVVDFPEVYACSRACSQSMPVREVKVRRSIAASYSFPSSFFSPDCLVTGRSRGIIGR